MKLKIGNIVVCKKDLDLHGIVSYDKNYKIVDMGKRHITIRNNENLLFSFDTVEEGFYFYDYFYTEKELRKKKLDEIHSKEGYMV